MSGFSDFSTDHMFGHLKVKWYQGHFLSIEPDHDTMLSEILTIGL